MTSASLVLVVVVVVGVYTLPVVGSEGSGAVCDSRPV